VRLNQFLFGFYPPSEYWRVVVAFSMVGVLVAWLLMDRTPRKGLVGAFTIFCYPVIAYFLFYGGAFGLPVVETYKWGGLMLTLILATTGMFFSFPIGIILALGRRSSMPIAKIDVCRFYRVLAWSSPYYSSLYVLGDATDVYSGKYADR